MKQFILMIGLVFAFALSAADLPKCEDSESTLSHIEGKWELANDIIKSMHGEAIAAVFTTGEITFTKDDAVLTLFSALEAEGKCAHFAGMFSMKFVEDGKAEALSSPFAIVEYKGNWAIMHEERGFKGGDHIHDMHPFITSFANAIADKNDVLFIGGDNADEPQLAFKRAK